MTVLTGPRAPRGRYATTSFFFLMIRPLPRSTLFPYTTLFRSVQANASEVATHAESEKAKGRGRSVVDTLSSEQLLRDLREERSEEHTSELQSRLHLVCRLLLEKKNNTLHADQKYS